jgi:hypothetical protein
MIGSGGDQSSLIEKGSQMLSPLLGGRDQSALAGAIGKFAGLGQGASGSLLGMLAPMIIGMIAEQQGARALYANRIASFLSSQKDNIAAALPSAFVNLLNGTGLLDALSAATRAATAGRGEADRGFASAPRPIGDTSRCSAGAVSPISLNWLYWLIPILAIALFVFLFANPPQQVAQEGATATQSLTVDGLHVGKQVTESITDLRAMLGGVNDAATAEAALPRLRNTTVQIDKIRGLIGQLSAEQRKTLTGLVTPMMPSSANCLTRCRLLLGSPTC